MKIKICLTFLFLITFMSFSIFYPPLPSYGQQPEKSAKIISFNGEVFIKSKVIKPKGEWIRLNKVGYALYNGDEVRTEKGTAEIEFLDGSIAKLLEQTSIGIDEGYKKKRALGIIKVSLASFWAKVKESKGKDERSQSRTMLAGIRGPLDKLQVGWVNRFEGDVFIKHKIMEPAGTWVSLKKVDYPLFNGDEIKTEKGTVDIEFLDGSIVKLSENASTGIDVSIY